MTEPRHALYCRDNGGVHDERCLCWCHDGDVSTMDWCRLCQIPVPTGRELPHMPVCPDWVPDRSRTKPRREVVPRVARPDGLLDDEWETFLFALGEFRDEWENPDLDFEEATRFIAAKALGLFLKP
jgi:hypothetical protein